MISLPGYDAWKTRTPPEYEWPDGQCEDCGGWEPWQVFGWRERCTCNEPPESIPFDPAEFAAVIDEAQEARTE